jgi:CspA family cold shock protein
MNENKSGYIKWYSPAKGYGFIAVENEPDVLLHFSVLRAFGVESIPDNARVTVETRRTEQGLCATKIVELDTNAPPRITQTDTSIEFERATVKWFDPLRGFGFLEREGKPDVFMHATTLKRCGITPTSIEAGREMLVRPAQRKNGYTAVDLHAG